MASKTRDPPQLKNHNAANPVRPRLPGNSPCGPRGGCMIIRPRYTGIDLVNMTCGWNPTLALNRDTSRKTSCGVNGLGELWRYKNTATSFVASGDIAALDATST